MSQVGEAFVVVRPLVQDFRGEVAAAVNTNLRSASVSIPVSPTIPVGSRISWETLASGAAIPKVLPLPVQPTITPTARAAFAGEVGGIRGALLGGGQFAASRALGISGLAAGLFVFGKAAIGAVKGAATLEQELNVFQQVSGATAEEMKRVRAEARKLGADISLPAVSAGDAAATMTELAKAGLSVDEVLGGTRGTLQLAAASQLDFASASELAAGALNEFELPGTQAVKIADLLAGAANAAQGEIGDFGLALSQAGAVAHQAGLSVQETVTFLTELAKAGIQGSDAGTSLRVSLLRLIAPTSEAKAIFKELGIEITDSAGNVRVDVFEQLRRSMEGLSPATRNAALATIFGTDAIRSAAIFTREGAAGFAEMERQVSREGQAADTARARTKGLSGSVSGLTSNLETLGTDLGTVVLPLLTELTLEATKGIAEFDALAVKVIDVADKIADIDLGPFGKVGDIVKDNVENAVSAPFQPLHAAIDLMRGDFEGAARDIAKTVPGLTEAIDAVFGKGGAHAVTGEDVGLRGAAARAGTDGQTTGESFAKGVARGIKVKTPEVVIAARRTVQQAQAALRDVVAEGARAIEASAVSAKQNLASIGTALAQQVTQILDSGPLAERIAALQAGIDKAKESLQRGTLKNDLRDAREALAEAEAQLAGGAPKTATQRAGEAEFLRPFKEKVKDAQAALEEFNTQGNIDKLSARLAAQKARIQRTLDDVIAKFNSGLLSAPQVNAAVATLLQKNVGPMGKAGTAQGFAFRQAFAAQVAALQAQVAAIVGGPRTTKTGAEPAIVSPADVAKDAATRTAAAQRSVKDAVIALHKTEDKSLEEAKKQTGLLADIKRQRASGNAKTSSTVKPRTDRGARTGGR